MPVDLDHHVNAAVQRAFASSITYTPDGGDPVEGLRGVFRDGPADYGVGDGPPSIGPAASLSIRLSEWPRRPTEPDRIEVAGRAFAVAGGVVPDDTGWAEVHLREI